MSLWMSHIIFNLRQVFPTWHGASYRSLEIKKSEVPRKLLYLGWMVPTYWV